MSTSIKNGCKMGVLLSMSFVWMSTMFGGGWATGMQSFVMGTRAGWPGILTQLVGIGLIALTGWITLEFARMAQVWNYRAFIDGMYRYKIVGVYYDIAQLIAVPIALGACVSTFASCLETNFGLNYWVGLIIFAVIILLSTMWGTKMLSKIGSYMGTAIIVLLVVCFCFVAYKNGYLVMDQVKAGATSEQWSEAWYWGAFRFWFLSGSQALSIIPVFKEIKTRKDSTVVCLTSFLLCAMFIVMIGFVVLTGMPGAAESSVPYLYALQQLDAGWINLVYVIIVSLAVLTTGNTILYSYQVRYCELKVIKNIKASENVKRFGVGLALIVFAVIIASGGLYAVIAQGYTYMAVLSGPVTSFGIPILGIAWMIWVKKKNLGFETGCLSRYWESQKEGSAEK